MRIAPLLALTLGLGTLGAQVPKGDSAAASSTYFTESTVLADGGSASSTTYALVGSVGSATMDGVATSTTYRIDSGFANTLTASGFGPWLTSAFPRFVTPLNSKLVFLTGMRLNLGTPFVSFGGTSVPVVQRTQTTVAIQTPNRPEPGFHPITLSNNGGSTTIRDAVGVLPMLFTEGAAASDVPFDLVFKGTKGDTVVWALGVAPFTPIPLPPYGHGLEINPGFIRVLPAMLITDANGELRLPIPPVPFNFTIYVQGLFLTSDPGYAPGSFSNLARF